MKIDPNFYDALMNASSVDYYRALNNNSSEIRLVVNEFYDPMREPLIAIDDYRTTHRQSVLYKIVSSDEHNMKLWRELEERVECRFFASDEDFYNVFSSLCYLDNICDDFVLRPDIIEHFFKPNVVLMRSYDDAEVERINDEVKSKTDLLVDQFLNNFRFDEDVVIDLGHGHGWELFKKKGVINAHNFDRAVVKDLWFYYLFYYSNANYSRNVDFDGCIEKFMKGRMFFRYSHLCFRRKVCLERLGLMR